jgi:hypothetical protein
MPKAAKQLSTSYLRQLVRNHNLTLPQLEQNRDAVKTAITIFETLGIDAALSCCVNHGIEPDAKEAKENPARYMTHLMNDAANRVALAIKGRETTYTAIKVYQSEGMAAAINYCKLQGIPIDRKTADNSWGRITDMVGKHPETNEYKPNLSGFRSTATGTVRTSLRLGHVCHNLKGESDGTVQTGRGTRKLVYSGRQSGLPQKYQVRNDYKDKDGKVHAIAANIAKPATSSRTTNEAKHYTEYDAQVERLHNAAHDPDRTERQQKACKTKAAKLRKLAIAAHNGTMAEHAPLPGMREAFVNVVELTADSIVVGKRAVAERAAEDIQRFNNAVERRMMAREQLLQSRR